MKEETNKITFISLHSIRRIMEKYCSYHISMEAVITLRDLLDEIASNIAIEAVRKFEKMNECRIKQGLRPLRRLNAWTLKNSDYTINIINSQKIRIKGLQSDGVVTPGGEK